MNEFGKTIVSIMGYAFAALLIAFTGYQTWSLLYDVSGNIITATLGLILFEGGMIYWWLAFQREAEGLPQMAISVIAAIFGLALVGGATGLHLGAFELASVGQTTPAQFVTAAAIVNLIAKFTFPLLAPNITHNIIERVQEGKLISRSYKAFDDHVDDIAAELTEEIGAHYRDLLRQRLITKHALHHPPILPGDSPGVNGVNGHVKVEAIGPPLTARQAPTAAQQAARQREYAETNREYARRNEQAADRLDKAAAVAFGPSDTAATPQAGTLSWHKNDWQIAFVGDDGHVYAHDIELPDSPAAAWREANQRGILPRGMTQERFNDLHGQRNRPERPEGK